jgi:hypothetical protein
MKFIVFFLPITKSETHKLTVKQKLRRQFLLQGGMKTSKDDDEK